MITDSPDQSLLASALGQLPEGSAELTPAVPEYDAKELYSLIVDDVRDRRDWYERVEKNRLYRLCQNKRKMQPYPGSPDLREPMIDDNVTQITAIEVGLLWNTRTVATFLPHSAEAMQFKANAEEAFDGMVKRTLACRSKFENLLDLKNERGFSVAKLIVNDEALPGQSIPDFEAIDQRDIIVPTVTRRCSSADRICHAVRYTVREFKDYGRRAGWDNMDAVIKAVAKKNTDTGGGANIGANVEESPADRATLNGQKLNSTQDEIVVWEVYHYRDEKQEDGTMKNRRWVCVFAPEAPELVLKQFPWRWQPEGFVIKTPEGDEVSVMKEGEDRPWPFVQFRFSNRNLSWYDTLGVADKLKQDQDFATANLQAKAVMMDYCCKPFLKGGSKLQTFKWRPGDSLPDGTDFAIPPRVDPVFDYNVDLARQSAAKRVGSPYGALTGNTAKSKQSKTASEVQATTQAQTMFSSDSVERMGEPLAELFTMMWEWLRHNRPKLLVINETQTQPMPEAAYDMDFTVVAGVSGKSANPDFMLKQLSTLGQFMGMYPMMSNFIRGDQMAKFVCDLLDPKATPLLVVDPRAVGHGGGAPIEQQMLQLKQAVMQIMQTIQPMQQYLTAMAAHETHPESMESGE